MNTKKWITLFMLIPLFGYLAAMVLSALQFGLGADSNIRLLFTAIYFLLAIAIISLLQEIEKRLSQKPSTKERLNTFEDSSLLGYFILSGIVLYSVFSIDTYHFHGAWYRIFYDLRNNVFLTFISASIGFLYYVLNKIQMGYSSYLGRTFFYIFSTCLLIALLILLNTDRTWRNGYRNIYDDIYENTYKILLKNKSLKRIKDPQITYLQLDDWPDKKELLTLLSIFSKYHPSVIGICSELPYNSEELVKYMLEFQNKIPKTKINFLDTRAIQDLERVDNKTSNISQAVSLVEGYSHYLERSYLHHSGFLPLYLKIVRTSIIENIDFGIKVYALHLRYRQSITMFDSIAQNKVRWLQKYSESTNERMVINHLLNPRIYSDLEHFFTTYRYSSTGYRWPTSITTPQIVHKLDWSSIREVDFNSECLLTKNEQGKWIKNQNDLPGVEGKILLVSVGDHQLAYTYTSIIQSIIDNNFLYEPSTIIYYLVAFIIVLLILVLYLKRNHWTAFLASIVILFGTAIAIIILYYAFNVLYNPGHLAIAILCSMMFYLPYEVLRNYRRVLEERLRYASELKAAHDMQMGLMPEEDPKIPGYNISGVCYPANEVGGDYYDYVWLDEDKNMLGIAVVDVSGKAMKAAITAVMTSGMVYNEINSYESPRTILRKINRPMYLKTDRNVFTALSFAVIDLKSKGLIFSNAGQMVPLLRRGGMIEYIKVEGPRLPLGVQAEVEYNEVSCQLQSDDVLVLFTDGIIEAKNSKDEFWGFEKMEEVVKNLPSTMSAKEMSEALIAEANRFAGTARQHDDMTVVVVKVL
ncbi:MAG: PP2C family protein-serine/threonine phosphatase [bacterium]